MLRGGMTMAGHQLQPPLQARARPPPARLPRPVGSPPRSVRLHRRRRCRSSAGLAAALLLPAADTLMTRTRPPQDCWDQDEAGPADGGAVAGGGDVAGCVAAYAHGVTPLLQNMGGVAVEAWSSLWGMATGGNQPAKKA